MNTFLTGIGICVLGIAVNEIGLTFALQQTGEYSEAVTVVALLLLIVGGAVVLYAAFKAFESNTR